jgi:predicted kinase
MSDLILIRGLPGSGKSTLAKKLAQVLDAAHFEADQYFVRDGVYAFDMNNLFEAHEWCRGETDLVLSANLPVIVSNTFTTLRELKPYFNMAKKHGVVPQVIHCQNRYGSIHGVPEETLERMRDRFCYDISPLFDALNKED